MRKIILATLLALTVAACGSYNGGSSPAGGAPAATPPATDASKTAAPSGNPDVDNYGY